MVPLTLEWKGDLRLESGSGSPHVDLRSSTPGVMSPMQALAYAVMGCMAMDVVHMLQKGRHPLEGLSVSFESEQAKEHPHRYTAIHLHFAIRGAVPDHAVARALELSRTTYCSVYNSLRQDIDFKATFGVER